MLIVKICENKRPRVYKMIDFPGLWVLSRCRGN